VSNEERKWDEPDLATFSGGEYPPPLNRRPLPGLLFERLVNFREGGGLLFEGPSTLTGLFGLLGGLLFERLVNF